MTDAKKHMKCHGCSTLMILDKQETGTGSRTQWHSCPLCGKVRLTSEPEKDPDAHQNSTHGRSNDIASPTISVTRKGTPYFA